MKDVIYEYITHLGVEPLCHVPPGGSEKLYDASGHGHGQMGHKNR